MLTAIFAAAVFCLPATVPQSPVVEDRCGAMEVNHVYGENAERVLSQLVFWDESKPPLDGRDCVVAWRLIKTENAIIPIRNHCGGYRAVWFDNGTLRSVRSLSCCESWTQFDVEMEDRVRLPMAERRGLHRDGKEPFPVGGRQEFWP